MPKRANVVGVGMTQSIRRICLVTPSYPTPEKPTEYTFVDQLACAVVDGGVEVVVISPRNLLRTRDLRTKSWERITRQGNAIQIIQPATLSFSSKKVMGLPTGRLTEYAFSKAVSRVLRQVKEPLDMFYGHFLVPAGTTVAKLGREYDLPSVCAFGESGLWAVQSVGMDYARKKLAGLSGVISVSSHNKQVLMDNTLADADKIAVFPNGVDRTLFYPIDRQEARRILDLPQEATIAVYTGAFSYGKGALRVQEAALRISDLNMLYIGGGPAEPEGRNILFKGKVAHEKIPLYLSAADFFVLPTLAEGCCNAIIEAMACGLPVISSSLPFNDDILDDHCALLIDPLNLAALQRAMETLTRDVSLRKQMARSALQRVATLDVYDRAQGIIRHLSQIIDKYRRR